MHTLVESDILKRVIGPDVGNMPPDVARHVLSWSFNDSDQDRVAELSEKAQLGTLTPEERVELEGFLNVNDFLAVLQMKAKRSLATGGK
jgi:hypothetical protein